MYVDFLTVFGQQKLFRKVSLRRIKKVHLKFLAYKEHKKEGQGSKILYVALCVAQGM